MADRTEHPESTVVCHCSDNQWEPHAASWGRTEVVRYALSFLESWAHSCDQVCDALCSADNYGAWLKRLTLEAPEVRLVFFISLVAIHMRHDFCFGVGGFCGHDDQQMLRFQHRKKNSKIK